MKEKVGCKLFGHVPLLLAWENKHRQHRLLVSANRRIDVRAVYVLDMFMVCVGGPCGACYGT